MEVKRLEKIISCVKDDYFIVRLNEYLDAVVACGDKLNATLVGEYLIVKPEVGFIGATFLEVNDFYCEVEIVDGASRKYENLSYEAAVEALKMKQLSNNEAVSRLFGDEISDIESLKVIYKSKSLKDYVVLNRFKTRIDTVENVYYFQKYKPYDVSGDINWGEMEPPYETRSWKYSFNAMFFLDSMVEAKEMGYALKIMKSWVEFNVNDGKRNDYAWYDMAVAIRAPKLAYIFNYAMINSLLSDQEIVRFCIALKVHIVDLMSEEKLALHSNHGLYQLSGVLGVVDILPEIQHAKNINSKATKLFVDVANKDVNDEGVHIEHSPAYHVFMLEMISSLIKCGWLVDSDIAIKLRKMEENLPFIFHPDQKYVRFGDTSDRYARHVLPEQIYVKYFKSEVEADLLIDASRVLPESGYAFFKSNSLGGALLAFSAAFHKRTHKHADDFTFEWSDYGQKILIDAGMFGYQRDAIEREFVQTTRAHNCVEIDDMDYSRYNLDIFGSAIKAWSTVSDVKVVEADLYRKRFFKTNHRRVIFYKPSSWMIVIDHLKSNEKHKFTQWFHFSPSLVLSQNLDNIHVDLSEERRLWIKPLSNSHNIEHIRAQFEPKLQGWTSIEPYQLTPNDALGFTVDGVEENTFATLFSFGSSTEKPELELFKSSSNGKYLRAKWNNADGKIEDIIYRILDKKRELHINGIFLPVTTRDS